MIPLPDGWRQLASVGSEILVSPDRAVQLRYRTRLPLRRFDAVVDEALGALPEWRLAARGARERLITHEGEYAFAVTADGHWLDSPAQRFLGVVYGDDFCNVLDAVSIEATPFAARARLLLASTSLQLGLRRRRYFYDLPAGWHGHATGLVSHWFPALFPARPATIVVYPAAPIHEPAHAVYEAVVRQQQALGSDLRTAAPPAAITTRHGLTGQHWRMTWAPASGPPVHRDLVVLVLGAYTYVLQLDVVHAPDPDARATFLALARSVEPIATGGAPAAAEPGGYAVFSHYV